MLAHGKHVTTKISNWEITVYALHILGGGLRYIPTEDIAVKCFEIAPDSFSWVKYPQYPDKDVVRRTLIAARDEKIGILVRGRAGRGRGKSGRTNAGPALDGWSLTAAGAKWILENESRLATNLKVRDTSPHRQELLQKINRIHRHPLFKTFLEQPEGFSPSLGEMAELFRCRVDADQGTWDKRFEMVVSQAQMVNDSKILEFINHCQASVKIQMKGT